MKINIVLPAIGCSGGIDVIYKYVDLLSKKGHDVIVYKEIKASNAYRFSSKIKNKIHQIYCTVKAVKASLTPKQNDRFVWKITNRTVRESDVIIATSWRTAFVVNNLSGNHKRKYYFIQDYEIWDNAELGKKTYNLPLNKIVISSWINERLRKELNIGPFPIVYNGIDKNVFHKTDAGSYKSGTYFLMLNHKLSKKGVKNGLKAFEKISNKYANCSLHMFGMCDCSDLPDYVVYHQNPSKEELAKLYSSSDIFIFPSLEEGWGLTPLEAMACGCAVVGTRTGFVLDFGIHGKNMMISEPGDCDAMVSNIEELLTNTSKLEIVKKGGLELASRLQWDISVSVLEKLLIEYPNG